MLKLARVRCPWPGDDPLMIDYHDHEWGVPLHDDRTHFEFIVLDGAQAGLSWRTILHKREGYSRACAGLDPAKWLASISARCSLLADPGIIRNRLKIGRDRQHQAFLKVPTVRFDTTSGASWGSRAGTAEARTASRQDRAVRCDEQGPQSAGSSSWARPSATLHAGGRDDQRPRGGLLPCCRAAARGRRRPPLA